MTRLEADQLIAIINTMVEPESVRHSFPTGTTTVQDLKCPECDGPMVARSGQYGKFWGCKRYPSCAGTRDGNGKSKAEREAEKKTERSTRSWTTEG